MSGKIKIDYNKDFEKLKKEVETYLNEKEINGEKPTLRTFAGDDFSHGTVANLLDDKTVSYTTFMHMMDKLNYTFMKHPYEHPRFIAEHEKISIINNKFTDTDKEFINDPENYKWIKAAQLMKQYGPKSQAVEAYLDAIENYK